MAKKTKLPVEPLAHHSPAEGAHDNPAATAKPEVAGFSPADGAPHGIPIRVRADGFDEVVAIRDQFIGWFNESRSGKIAFTPSEWRHLIAE